jgi:hypothetical protein
MQIRVLVRGDAGEQHLPLVPSPGSNSRPSSSQRSKYPL